MKTYLKASLLLVLILAFLPSKIEAKNSQPLVDTIQVYSEKMEKSISNVIVFPDKYYESNEEYPVVYLLHGYTDNYKTWVDKTKPDLQNVASQYQVIFVCPDGELAWYLDSPIDPKVQYETYVSQDLLNHIDKNYKTKSSAKYRAIAGFSMGGHGALTLAMKHPDTYGACGSMSGVLDLVPLSSAWNLKSLLGDYGENKELWHNNTVMHSLHKLKATNLAIIIDCGTGDFLFNINERVHKEMSYQGIQHEYITRPGGHTHPYWSNAFDYQMLFFDKFFKSHK